MTDKQTTTAATPGPWRSRVMGSEGARIFPDTGDKREDMKYLAIVNGRDTATDCANGRLMAAAPDLLAALEDLLTYGGTSEEDWAPQFAVENAREAVRKARNAD